MSSVQQTNLCLPPILATLASRYDPHNNSARARLNQHSASRRFTVHASQTRPTRKTSKRSGCWGTRGRGKYPSRRHASLPPVPFHEVYPVRAGLIRGDASGVRTRASPARLRATSLPWRVTTPARRHAKAGRRSGRPRPRASEFSPSRLVIRGPVPRRSTLWQIWI